MQQVRARRWPWIAVLNCVLAILLLAAGRWRLAVRAERFAAAPVRSIQTLHNPEAKPGVDRGRDESSAAAMPPRELAWEEARAAREKTSSRADKFDFESYRAPRQLIRIAPPVADRITLDPSLAETPSLPTLELPKVAGAASPVVTRAQRRADHIEPVSQPAPRRPAQLVADIASPWPWPTELVAELEKLRGQQACAKWADQVLEHLRKLHASESLNDRAAGSHLQALRDLEDEVEHLAPKVADTNQRAQLLRVSYALERRLAIWQPLQTLTAAPVLPVSIHKQSASDVRFVFNKIDDQLQHVTQADLWQRYLLLDQLRDMATNPRRFTALQRSELARRILRRMNAPGLNDEQRKFFAKEPWPSFAAALKQWVSEPVDYRLLLDDLERYELEPNELVARRVAHVYQVLRWSPVPAANTLADWINAYYRNANVRLSVSGDFVNSLLPDLGEMEEPVNDVLLGSRIRGQSRVSTRLRVVLLPDRLRWRLGLEAHGEIDSRTSTKHGPAKFYNVGRGQYLARKLLLIDRLGLHSHRAEANAQSEESLARLETDFDNLPLVNVLARAIAKQQYDSKSHLVKWRVRDMIAARARRRLDEEVDRQIAEMKGKFETRVHQPLVKLGLDPEAVDMQTTEHRLIARYRLAGVEQLAAFTPRPQAPSDALMSIQIHESVLNNTVAALRLGEQTRSLRQLFLDVAQKFQVPNFQVPEDVPEDVTIRMAAVEPIRFRFEKDRIHIRLRIARLTAERRSWRDFEVRASYAPQSEGLHARLVRDGYIKLKGRRLSFGDQLALRGVFSKVLPKKPDFDILGQTFGKDARLRQLVVNQFVMRDGWIGVALTRSGPIRMHLADRPAPVVDAKQLGRSTY